MTVLSSASRVFARLRRVVPVDPPVTRIVPELRDYPYASRPRRR